MKRYHILFLTKSSCTLPKRVYQGCLQRLRGQLNKFPKDEFIPFHPTTPKASIHTRRIPLKLPILKHIITFFLKCSNLMSFFTMFKAYFNHTYSYKTRVLQPTKSRSHIFTYISCIKKTDLCVPNKEPTFHISHIYKSFKYKVGTLSLPHKIPHQYMQEFIIDYLSHIYSFKGEHAYHIQHHQYIHFIRIITQSFI